MAERVDVGHRNSTVDAQLQGRVWLDLATSRTLSTRGYSASRGFTEAQGKRLKDINEQKGEDVHARRRPGEVEAHETAREMARFAGWAGGRDVRARPRAAAAKVGPGR